jgi:hypothetical protein
MGVRRVVYCTVFVVASATWTLNATAGLLPSPVLRGSINLRSQGCIAPHDVEYWKGHIYLSGHAATGEGPTVWDIDVTDPGSPVCLRAVGAGYKAYGLKIVQDKAYVANWYTLLRVHDVYGGALTQLGEYFRSGQFGWAVDVARGRVWVTQGSEVGASTECIDVTNPSRPTLISSLPAVLSSLGGGTIKGSYYYYGDNHYSQTIPKYYFAIANYSDEANPYVMTLIERPNPVGGVLVRDNYAYVFSGGIEVFDISDPTAPRLLGYWYSDTSAGPGCLYGDYAIYATSGNGVLVVNISDPSHPWPAAQPNYSGYELAVTAAGRYLYIGNLYGDWEGVLNIVEIFDSDPDNAGPGNWTEFSLKDAPWDTQYEADAMPRASSPSWKLFEGTEAIATVEDGVLHINDNLTTAKVKWIRNWDATNTHGTTVVCRARCASYEVGSGSITTMGNIYIEDGKYQEVFAILSDKLRANWANIEVPINGTQWHTYRITTKGPSFQVYVDEAPTPIMTGNFVASTANSRIAFGSGSTLCKQDIYIDYVHCCSSGAYGPAGATNDQTPDISINVADTAGKGSLSGIDPTTAQVYWSRDGGKTWNTGGCTVVCTPIGGLAPPDRGTITAYSVPFNQYSETQNKIRFSLKDRNGNIGYSPIYNVRIMPNVGPKVVNVTSPNTSGTYRQGSRITIHVVFDRNITVSGGLPRLKLAVVPGGRWVNCSGYVGGNTLVFSYTVQANDSAECLDYVDCDSLDANGAVIKDEMGSSADLRLPTPGGPGSLCANKQIKVDAVKPVVTNVTSDLPDGTYGIGQIVDILVAFSEPVTVTGTPQLELETGVVDRLATYVSGSGTPVLRFRYVVQRCDSSADLDYKSADSLTGTIRDIAGNSYVYPGSLPSPGSPGSLGYNKDIVIDTRGSIGICKTLPDGATVALGGKLLYFKSGLWGYIEELDRTSAIRIEGTITASQGDVVCLAGIMRTSATGERFIELTDILTTGNASIKPIGVTNKSLADRLVDGLYVRVWGQVKEVSLAGHWYVITDGSAPEGIKILTAVEPSVSVGDYVLLTGAAGWDGRRVVYQLD